MDIKRIIADIDYITPRGAIPKYKYGVAPKARAIGPISQESTEVVESPSLKDLKAELSKPHPKPKAEFELVGGEDQ